MEGLITKPTTLAAIGQAWSWGPGGAFTPWVPLAIPTNALTAPSTPGLPACNYVVRPPLWAMQGKKLRAPESEHPPSHSGPDGFSAQSSLAETVFMPVTHPGHFTRVRGMGGSPEPEHVGSLLIRIDRRRRCPPGEESRHVWRISRAWINHRPPDAPRTCLMSIEAAIRLRGRTAWSVGKPPAGGGKGASATAETDHSSSASRPLTYTII